MIKTLECDSLAFIETIEPRYGEEIENIKIKKHCPSWAVKMKIKALVEKEDMDFRLSKDSIEIMAANSIIGVTYQFAMQR